MKKLTNYLMAFALTVALGLTGCGNADVDGKGAATEDSKTSPEMQAEIDKMQKGGMAKQFGNRAGEAPESGDDE